MSNTTPISLDFLSDPSAAVSAIKRIEVALMQLEGRVTLTGRAMQLLSKALPGSDVASKMAEMARSAGQVSKALTSGAAQASQMTAGLAQLTAMQAQITALAQSMQQLATATRNLPRNVNLPRQPGQGGPGAPQAPQAPAGGGALDALTTMGLTPRLMTVAGAVAAVGFAIKDTTGKAMDFEKAMSGVAAVGEIKKTSLAFEQLSAAAMSGSSSFNAIQKAGGLRELVAAGMSASQAAGSLSATLSLASAGEIEMGRAAEIMVAAMSAFKMEAKDTTRIIDNLTAAANASPASIDDMGESLKFIAPIASALKVPIEDVSALLAILANNGIRGGMAGRGLGAVMARLVAPTVDAQEAMRAAGVTARDLNPALNSLGSVMGRLASLDQQTLVKLFGAENLDISNVLAANAQGFDAMQKKMQDSAGAGQRFESAITDNVAGSIKKLMNTVTDAQITLGSQTNGMLKGMVDGLTSFVRSASTGMNDLTSQLSGGDEQGQLNRMTEAFANLQERLKGAQSAGQVKDIAEQIQFLGKQIVRLESDTQSGRLLDVLTFGLTGPSQDTMTKVAELGKQVSDVVKQVATDTDSILADNAKAAAARAEMEKARVAAMDPDLALYPPGTTSSLLAGPELPANFDLEARRESVKLAQEREEIERKAAAQEQRRADYMAQLAVDEAKAAGDTSRADKLERELNILNEQRRIMQEFGMGEGEARDLAIRAINARKKDEPERQAALVASNLQSIGGGGGVFGGVANLPQRQVALSEQMLVEAKKTNDLLRPDTRSAVSEKSSTEMTSLLRTIAQNTSRSSILRVSNN
jgi:TP901 family phage tail tape measure protein